MRKGLVSSQKIYAYLYHLAFQSKCSLGRELVACMVTHRGHFKALSKESFRACWHLELGILRHVVWQLPHHILFYVMRYALIKKKLSSLYLVVPFLLYTMVLMLGILKTWDVGILQFICLWMPSDMLRMRFWLNG